MKKVLILAYDFPPYVSVAGLRPKAWLDYFKNVGIEPVVITRQWENRHGNHLDYISEGSSKVDVYVQNENGLVIRTPFRPNLSNRLLLKYGESKFRLLRKSITAFYEIFQFIIPIGTKRELYRAAKEYISINQVDCIIATGDPFVLFHYAKILSRKNNIPWIADYRDPWSSEFDNRKISFLKIWSKFIEKKTVKSAKVVTTVSEIFKLKIKEITNHDRIEIYPNGYDSNLIENTKNHFQGSDVLRIGFAGSISIWNPIDSFFKSLSDFEKFQPNQKIEFHFYGVNIKNKLEEIIQTKYPNLKNVVYLFPPISNAELLCKLANTNALLLFNHYSIIGTKIFDYIGLGRKILLCYTDDTNSKNLKTKHFLYPEINSISNNIQEELIEKTNSGISIKDGEHLKQVLLDLSEEFNSTGQIACNSINVENYSRKIQTEKLADLIKSIC